MKFVIILLLSTTGVEEIKIKTSGLKCGDIGAMWRQINTTYRGPGPNQGNFTSDGKLMIGYRCE
jgi:hypothetical protein